MAWGLIPALGQHLALPPSLPPSLLTRCPPLLLLLELLELLLDLLPMLLVIAVNSSGGGVMRERT